MPFDATFIGNESPFLDVVRRLSNLNLVVCSRPDERTRKYFGSSFDYAKKYGIPVITPERYLKNPVSADIIIVSGFSKLLPKPIIRHPKIGIINIHQSLLPAYRGRHSLNWAIINGEKYTGVSIHHIDGAFDNGNIIFQKKIKISDDDTIMDVYHKTVKEGCRLLRKTFSIINSKKFKGRKQDKSLISYYPPRRPRDGLINWNEPAVKIRNMSRALTEPYPGAYFYHRGSKIVIDKAEVLKKFKYQARVGEIFPAQGSLVVKTGNGYLKILKTRNNSWKKILKK